MTGNREVEVSRLARRVEEIQKLIREGGKPGPGYSLAAFLEDAQAKLDTAHADLHAETESRERKEREFTASVVELVERESRLNAAEKEQYGRFLEMDYFTKADVENLDKFYAGAWDRLSNDGKAEMSQRLWEGIRRGELEFSDLAEETRRKESDFLYQRITGQVQTNPPLWDIPEQDKADFVHAYEAKDEKGVTEVLSRESFSQHVGKSASGEADYSKKINSEEKKPDDGVEKAAAGEFGNLSATFGEAQASVKPTELNSAGGGLSRF